MRNGWLISLSAALLVTPVAAMAAICDRQPANGTTFKVGDAVGFTSAVLNVDADGAPNSYRVDGNGLSFTCDGVEGIVNLHAVGLGEPHWQDICNSAFAEAQKSGDYSHVRIFGFLTDTSGKPVVQGDGDPLPGLAFVTTTSMSVPGTAAGTQRHYVDATRIPYIVLSSSFICANGVMPGDVAVVYRPKTDRAAFAVYADGGNLGEASVKLHEDLGSHPIVTRRGVDRATSRIEDRTVTIVFPGHTAAASADTDAWAREIQVVAGEAFRMWGGLDRIRDCAH